MSRRNPLVDLTPLRNVSVCAGCKRASCVQGVFVCKTPKPAILLPLETVRYLDNERSEFWTAEWRDMAKARPT